ncbi:hypothetical protein CAEBREN_19942 [Caenorhabditis brenneri]|uniref:Uncharacterized protein n=1 Tax=Caenorhabditis brenneri TaxID=135651 RepID=G0P487_CAEBE|nr:hypothetical protein CAEBREN_19942 [Caenorhabditis brenneri]
MARRRKLSPSSTQVDHRIFSIYSLTISFVYMLRIAFELVAMKSQEMDIQWQVTECLFVVFGVLISIALHNAYDTLVIKRIQSHIVFSPLDVVKFILDVIHFFNIPVSLYFICVFLVSSKTHKRRRSRKNNNKVALSGKQARSNANTGSFGGDLKIKFTFLSSYLDQKRSNFEKRKSMKAFLNHRAIRLERTCSPTKVPKIPEKNIIKKQFEVSNVFVGDEMVYYV